MQLKKIQKALSGSKPELEEKFGITKIGIFGSYAKGRQKAGSDLDLVADFTSTPTIFQIMRAERFLSRRTGIRVDLSYKQGLKPSFIRNISREMVIV